VAGISLSSQPCCARKRFGTNALRNRSDDCSVLLGVANGYDCVLDDSGSSMRICSELYKSSLTGRHPA
jgi:hypothetical protein